MSCRYLAIDPGITTGYCVFEVEPEGIWEPIEFGNLRPEDLASSLIAEKPEQYYFVAIEDMTVPTMGVMNQVLRSVLRFFDGVFPNAIRIRPGVWKSSVSARYPAPLSWNGEPLSQHEQDAYHLGMHAFHLPFQNQVLCP